MRYTGIILMSKKASIIVLILIIVFSLSLISVNASCSNPNGGNYCGAASGSGNCYCDEGCASYGDCCPDYKSVCQGAPQEENTNDDSGCNPTGKTCNEIDGAVCVFEHYSNCNGKCVEYCKSGCDGEKAECIGKSSDINPPQPPFLHKIDISGFDGLKYANLYWDNVNGEIFYTYKSKN